MSLILLVRAAWALSRTHITHIIILLVCRFRGHCHTLVLTTGLLLEEPQLVRDVILISET